MTQQEMLRQAAAQADQAIRRSLPAPEDCRPQFSPDFEKKMNRLLRRVQHPIFYRLPQYAACLVLAVLVAGGGWLTVDAGARSYFMTWVRQRYDAFVEYRFVGEKPEGQLPQYCLTELPTGYTEAERIDMDNLFAVIYRDEQGNQIVLSYTWGSDASSLFVVGEIGEEKRVPLEGTVADLYLPKDPKEASVLVWISEQDGIAFSLSAVLPEEELLRLCQGMQKE